MKNEMENKSMECACGENCRCDGKESRCHEVAKCAYKVAKLVLKAATVCALVQVAKEMHKVHKAIEHKHHDGHKHHLL